MRRVIRNKPRPGMAALPYTADLQTQISDAAAAGAAPGTLTSQLLALGYTMAQVSQLYNTASSTATLTPQVLQYLQTENGYLQDQLNAQNRLWMWLGFGALAVYLVTTPPRSRAVTTPPRSRA